MFSFALPSLVLSLSPVVIVPGLYGSRFRVSFNHSNLPWYCSSSVNRSLLFFQPTSFIFPFTKCFVQSLNLAYNPQTRTFQLPEHETVEIDSSGSTQDVEYVIRAPFGLLKSPMKHVTDFLVKRGYERSVTLLGSPNDWRFGFQTNPQHFDQLKSLIERAFVSSNHSITLLAHSMGCGVTQQFLNSYVTDDWKSIHVKRVIYLAPSWGGIGLIPYLLYRKSIPYLPFSSFYKSLEPLLSLPSALCHYPNDAAFHSPIVIDEGGQNLNASESASQLFNGREDFEVAQSSLKAVLKDPLLETHIIYNSGLKTVQGINLSSGERAAIWGKGDYLCNAESAIYACESWGNVSCTDLDEHGIVKGNHNGILSHPTSFRQLEIILGLSSDGQAEMRDAL
jgi:pimeloyl-ACP methyl ester carboxylesterase